MDLYNKIMYVQHEPIVIESVEYEHKGPAPNTTNTATSNNTNATTTGPYKSRTKSDLLDQVFAECIQSGSIKELLESSSAVHHKLNVLDLHHTAQVLLLPARGEQRLPEEGVSLDALMQHGGTVTRGQGPLRCRLLVQLTEHKPLTLRAATTHTTGVGETSLEFSATHRNLFGRAERGHVTAVITASQSSVLQASLARPVLIGPTFAGVAELQVGQSLTHSPLSSHRELKRDLVARWRYKRHELAYEWAWRHVTLMPGATERMLSEGGDSVKSALKHRYLIAQLDDMLTPTRGFALRFVQELAGLGGDVKFLKHELDFNYNVPLAVKGMSFNFLFKAGTHVPLFDSKSYITDRFFLGGATIFRAFANKGVGPRFRRDSYGGDVMYNASAYLSGPLPVPKSNIGELRGHVFGHVGSLISINRKKGLKDHIETLVEQYRASVGVGVVLKTVFGARIELNYALPLKFNASDRVQSLQLGIAFDFL